MEDFIQKNAKIIDFDFEIHDSPYKHIVGLKKVCSCMSWQLKEISCAHALTTCHYNDWIVESFLGH